jgi:hypothetical protein
MLALRTITLLATASLVIAAIPADQITNLPGWEGALPSAQYSGKELDFNA